MIASAPANIIHMMSGLADFTFWKAGPKSCVPNGKKSAPTSLPPAASKAAFTASVLARGQIGERGRQELAVLELGHGAGAEAHRGARVEQDHEAGIGLAEEALDIGALGAREHVPVDEARIVAFDVGAILLELLAETVMRRAVQARQETFHGRARDQLEVRETRQDFRRQQSVPDRGVHLAITSFSTASTLLPSDSAW